MTMQCKFFSFSVRFHIISGNTNVRKEELLFRFNEKNEDFQLCVKVDVVQLKMQ